MTPPRHPALDAGSCSYTMLNTRSRLVGRDDVRGISLRTTPLRHPALDAGSGISP